MDKGNLKIYAHYLPQFHETQENNIWWGKGFTEWNNVKSAKPLFKLHKQPRIPLNKNYYDLSNIDTLKWQSGLAQDYGIEGFSIYHYWSSGVQLLSTPVKLIIENPEININFNIVWANHPWVRSWKNSPGKDSLLLDQNYEVSRQDREIHYQYISRLMKDKRYSRLDGKPFFSIYRTYDISNFAVYLDEMRDFIYKDIGEEIHINSMIQYPPKDKSFAAHIDTVSLFQPGTAMYNTDSLDSSVISIKNSIMKLKELFINAPLPIKSIIYKILDKGPKSASILEYDKIWDLVLSQSEENRYLGKKVIRGAYTDWDNTPRYGSEATIFNGSSPENFKNYFRKLAKIVKKSDCPQVILVNAWNEWGEACYLEPDELNGYGYLEALRDVLKEVNENYP